MSQEATSSASGAKSGSPTDRSLSKPLQEWLQDSLCSLRARMVECTPRADVAQVAAMLRDYQRHLTRAVPAVWCPTTTGLVQDFNQQAGYDMILQPLEWLVTGMANPKECFLRLRSICPPPQLCGKVFKAGEPNYNCRDCAQDATCVLCVDCFKNSVHRNHRYRIGHSTSGYCDCGDQEAWKANHICSMHERLCSKESFEASLASVMPVSEFDSMTARLEASLHWILDYVYTVLRWTGSELPEQLEVNWNHLEPVAPGEPEYGQANYCVVLLNDETHTYEHVIYALNKAVKCDHKLATDYATLVDREGRCIIYIGDWHKCQEVAAVITDVTKKNSEYQLGTQVLATRLYAHQVFAQRLLIWLTELMPVCQKFRLALGRVVFEKGHLARMVPDFRPAHSTTIGSDDCLLEKIFKSDIQFWKAIRIQWHQLFMRGLLLDLDLKREFARVFTRNFAYLLKDYMDDDHEHRVSILAITVQIYTVNSVAVLVMEEEDALAQLINAFLELNTTYHQTGRFRFDTSHNRNSQRFRRATASIHDMCYLLHRNCTPEVWSEALKSGFLRGIEAFLKMLKRMMMMDAVVRQVVQHIEYEPGWDVGITFQAKICNLITSALTWATANREVYVDTLNLALRLYKDFFDFYSQGGRNRYLDNPSLSLCTQQRKHVAGHSAYVYAYDVSRQEVSIHSPLARFIAALLLHLPSKGLTYGDISDDCPLWAHRPTIESLIEMPLRTQVLIAQFRAGMWRRNGYSLINQIMYYFGVRLREEMFDRDILMLQIGAAWIDANEFLIHLLNKFGLDTLLDEQVGKDQKAKLNDDQTRHQITLVEEFFRLISTILVERYVVGLGQVNADECVVNEVIQWLCKEPMTNSDLLSHFITDDETKIEDLVATVAEFRKPASGTSSGRFHLREAYYQRFNPFFYHYTRQDQSAAVESQLRRMKVAKVPLACPPPPLPDWMPAYEGITQLLLCDVMMSLMRTVLRKTCDLTDQCFSDFHFQQVLYLIGIALNEQMKHPRLFRFTAKAMDAGLVPLLEQCTSRHILPRIENHKDLYDWVFDRFKQALELASGPPSKLNDDARASAKEEEEARAKAALEQDRSSKKKMAAACKDRIMAQFKKQQKAFMEQNKCFFQGDSSSSSMTTTNDSSTTSSVSSPQSSSFCSLKMFCHIRGGSTDSSQSESSNGGESVALGVRPNRIKYKPKLPEENPVCILCLESQSVDDYNGGNILLMPAFLQKSTVLSQNRQVQSWTNKFHGFLPRSDLNFAPFISVCTHYMHAECFDKYIEASATNERRRPAHRHARNSYDLMKKEFLCPLCETISNMALPVMPNLTKPVRGEDLDVDMPMDHWLRTMTDVMNRCNRLWTMEVESFVSLPSFQESFTKLISVLSTEQVQQLQSVAAQYRVHVQPVMDPKNPAPRFTRAHTFFEAAYTHMKKEGQTSSYEKDGHEILQTVHWATAYTIKVLERIMTVDGSRMTEVIDTRLYQTLRGLVCLQRAQLHFYLPIHPRRILMSLLDYLLVTPVYTSSPYSCLDLDAFSLLVSLVAHGPSLISEEDHSGAKIDGKDDAKISASNAGAFFVPLGNAVDRNMVTLMLTLHLVQIMLTNPCPSEVSVEEDVVPMEVDEETNQTPNTRSSARKSPLVNFYCDVLMAAGHQFETSDLTSLGHDKVESFLKQSLLPFMRQCALYFYFLTDAMFPKVLWQKSDTQLTKCAEYDLWSQYLAQPKDLASLAQISSLRHLALHWAKHPTLKEYFAVVERGRTSLVAQNLYQPHPLRQLVDLPYDFADLINSVANFTCPNSNGEESRNPTMCLLCGELLCSQNYCCQKRLSKKDLVGACTYHANQCSAGVGLFLRIRDCKVLLLTTRFRGCYLASPYLDKYGETDQGLLRGDPMTLSTSSYQNIYRLWLRHLIPEQIVHQMESSPTMAATNWSML